MTFENADLQKTEKQILAEFRQYKEKNGNCQTLVDVMTEANKKYPKMFRNIYSDNSVSVNGSGFFLTNADRHKLPMEFRGKQGCLTMMMPLGKFCGNYFSNDYYQIITGWNYLIDIPKGKINNAPKAKIKKFINFLIKWDNSFGDKDLADQIWKDFEKFCEVELGAIIRH